MEKQEFTESLRHYIAESLAMPKVGDTVTINRKFRGMYKAFKLIYGEVLSVDLPTKTAKVEWETRRIIPDSIPLSHLDLVDEDEDEDDED